MSIFGLFQSVKTGQKVQKSIFGRKILQEHATTIQLALLSYIFIALSRDTSVAHIFSAYSPMTNICLNYTFLWALFFTKSIKIYKFHKLRNISENQYLIINFSSSMSFAIWLKAKKCLVNVAHTFLHCEQGLQPTYITHCAWAASTWTNIPVLLQSLDKATKVYILITATNSPTVKYFTDIIITLF